MKRVREGNGGFEPGKRASRPGPSTQPKLTTTDALSYLREVKTRFSDHKDVYDTFLEIMKEFKSQRIDTAGVIQRVKQLFKGHRELVLGFNTFLPKGHEIELARISEDEEEEEEEADKKPGEFDQAINYVNKIKLCFSRDERVYKAFLEILNTYRKGQKTIRNVYEDVAVLFRHHQDLLDEFSFFLPDNSQPCPPPRGRQQRPGFGRGRGEAAAAAAGPNSPPDPRSVHKRKAARRAEEGFRAGYGTGSYDRDREEEPAARPALARELQFFDRIKQRLRNGASYTDLLKCLNLYSQEIVSRHELMFLVGDVIGKSPDLMNNFYEFLGKVEVMDLDVADAAKPNSQQMMIRETMRHKQLQKDKYMTKPLSEIVTHDLERVTPSYVFIPSGYPNLSTSGRTELGHCVLNETFVNVITGSEDYSFKLMRKNQYEEALFRCEDDRYEFEMCIETNFAALKLLCPIVDIASKLSPDKRSSYQLEEDHPLLGPVPANAIERLYADSGAHMVEHLRKHPAVVAPIVLARMEAKDAEWRKIREEMTKTWRKIFDINYHKSLDHRSFYFKQAEKKSLHTRAMVAELREASETRKSEQPHVSLESTFRSMLSQRRRELPSCEAPDLSYDYSDRAVFDDCWAVLQTAILESTGIGSKHQVVELYLKCIEPFFGLPARQGDLDRIKNEMREKRDGRLTAGEGEDSENDSSSHDEDTRRAVPESTPEHGADTDMDAEDGNPKKRSSERFTFKREDSNMSEGEAGSEDDDERKFGCCRPVVPYFFDSKREVVKVEESNAKSCLRSWLLLGNEMIFVFFRFHRHLYERMRTARRCSLQQAQQQRVGKQFRQIPVPAADGAKPTAEEIVAQAELREHANRVHASFMTMTQQVLTGELETVLYEDQVRALLGTNSYELFTIDKLLHKLIAHMSLLMQDDQSSKLLKLHAYELSRGVAASSSASYHVNSQSLLEDTVFRIEYRASNSELTVQLLERDSADAFPPSLPCCTEGPINQNLADFVSDLPSAAVIQTAAVKRVILHRNLSSKQQGSMDEALMAALKRVVVFNGLECKMSCTTSKVSYVLGTEDVICRPSRVMKQGTNLCRQGRSQRFHSWLDATIKRLKREEEVAMTVAGPH